MINSTMKYVQSLTMQLKPDNNNDENELLTASKYFWKYLKHNMVETIFGLPGGGVVPLLQYFPSNMNWINMGNEEQNGFLAQVYGQYTNNVGILIVTYGPGICNSINPLVNAVKENNPLILISTFNPNASVNDFQNTDFRKILQGATKYCFEINKASDFAKNLSMAYNTSKNKNTGVALMINIDILSSTIQNINMRHITYKSELSSNAINKIRKKIVHNFKKFDKTLIVLGKGNFTNFNIIKDFIVKNELPYVTTSKGRMIINNYPHYCGRLGSIGNHSANYALYKAESLIVIGNLSGGLTNEVSQFYENRFSIGLNYFTNQSQDNRTKRTRRCHIGRNCAYTRRKRSGNMSNLNHKKTLLQLSIDDSTFIIDKDNNNISSYIIDDFSPVFHQLKVVNNPLWNRSLKHANNKLLVPLASKSKLEQYISSAAEVYSSKKLDIAVTTGVGNHWYSCNKYFDTTIVNSWHSPTTLSSIGVGFTNGYGMYLAQKRPIWIFEGDGGSAFSFNALVYLYENCSDLPLTIHITIDSYYSAIVTSYIIKKKIPENYKKSDPPGPWMKTNKTPKINYMKFFPDALEFNNVSDYASYINKTPYTEKLRIILLNISDEDPINNIQYGNSNIYEINFNKDYYNMLENNEFDKIHHSELVIASED